MLVDLRQGVVQVRADLLTLRGDLVRGAGQVGLQALDAVVELLRTSDDGGLHLGRSVLEPVPHPVDAVVRGLQETVEQGTRLLVVRLDVGIGKLEQLGVMFAGGLDAAGHLIAGIG